MPDQPTYRELSRKPAYWLMRGGQVVASVRADSIKDAEAIFRKTNMYGDRVVLEGTTEVEKVPDSRIGPTIQQNAEIEWVNEQPPTAANWNTIATIPAESFFKWLAGRTTPDDIDFTDPKVRTAMDQDRQALKQTFERMAELNTDNLHDAANMLADALTHSPMTQRRLRELSEHALNTGDRHLLFVLMTELAKFAFPEDER